MKSIASKLMLGAAAFAFIGSAHAATYLRLTGSSAYRSAVHTAIRNIAWDAAPSYAYTGTSLSGASQAIFHGNIAGVDTYIKTSWTGSEAGIQAVAGDLPASASFLQDSTTTSTSGTPSVTTNGDTTHPDACMSDTFQASSVFYNSTIGSVTYGTLATANTGSGTDPAGVVGVVPFKFCTSRGSVITDITSQLAQNLYSSGKVSLSLFTGNSADVGTKSSGGGNGKWIFATGRDPDSGTRLTALAEIGLGGQSGVTQFQPSTGTAGSPVQVTAAGTTITVNVPFPAGTINGIAIGTGNNGYSSGGNLAKAINGNTTGMVNGAGSNKITGGSYVAYLGTSDADPQITGSASTGIVELSYNGVTLGNVAGDYNTSTVLTYGKYTFWGYEHMYYKTGLATTVTDVADKVAKQLHDTDAVVKLSSMKVSRTTDGAVVQ
ncbi:MAG: hypothetical protein ABIP97_13800 [Chthoniobacterales bacterium]